MLTLKVCPPCVIEIQSVNYYFVLFTAMPPRGPPPMMRGPPPPGMLPRGPPGMRPGMMHRHPGKKIYIYCHILPMGMQLCYLYLFEK